MAWLKAEHGHVDYRDYLPENVYLETVMRRPAGVFTHDRHSGNSIWKYVFNLILLFYIAYALCAPSYQIIYRRLGVMRAALALPPNREIDFDFDCDCIACVLASERSCVSARESLSVASARQRNLRVPPAGRRSELKVRAV